MSRTKQFEGIHIRRAQITFSQAFVEKYIKSNKYVSPSWNEEEGVLGLTFYPTDSETSFRLPIVFIVNSNSCRVHSARFLKQISQFKLGRYEASDADFNSVGNLELKFKLEKL